MLRNKNGSVKSQPDKLNTIIGKSSVINGTVRIENSARLDGRLIGEIHCTGTVTVGSQGDVEGDIYSQSAIIGGKVKGRIETSEQIILEAGSVFIGDLKTSKLTIDEGAMFEGNCLMVKDKEPPKDAAKKES